MSPECFKNENYVQIKSNQTSRVVLRPFYNSKMTVLDQLGKKNLQFFFKWQAERCHFWHDISDLNKDTIVELRLISIINPNTENIAGVKRLYRAFGFTLKY